MLPVFPSNTREQIEDIIDMIGRPVYIYNEISVSGCSLCTLDPISNTSTDSFCPQCSGEYWIPTYSGTEVTAHVTWGKSENIQWATGGMVENGDVYVKFMHSASLESLIGSAKWIIVDGREMDIVDITLRGVPTVNRILAKLKEKEK